MTVEDLSVPLNADANQAYESPQVSRLGPDLSRFNWVLSDLSTGVRGYLGYLATSPQPMRGHCWEATSLRNRDPRNRPERLRLLP
jgi:hypothetical protein